MRFALPWVSTSVTMLVSVAPEQQVVSKLFRVSSKHVADLSQGGSVSSWVPYERSLIAIGRRMLPGFAHP